MYTIQYRKLENNLPKIYYTMQLNNDINYIIDVFNHIADRLNWFDSNFICINIYDDTNHLLKVCTGITNVEIFKSLEISRKNNKQLNVKIMNQETRNKKNKKYQANLERRYGITKKSDYIKMMSDGIEKSEKRNPMDGKYEFVTTRNKFGDIVTRSKYTYHWTAQAKAIQKLYHETKNGIESKVTKPKESTPKLPKRARLANREFSRFHYELIEGLYMNNKYVQIIKNTEATAKHEQKIKDLMHKLMISKANKPSYKLFKKTKKNNLTHTEALGIAA